MNQFSVKKLIRIHTEVMNTRLGEYSMCFFTKQIK